MPNELQVAEKAELLSNLPPNTMAQIGNNNTQVAHANTVKSVTNLILPLVQTKNGATVNTVSLCRDCYNLFVIEGEAFSDIIGHFTVPKDRALTESIADELKAQFSTLQEDAIARIKSYPSIFASTNRGHGKTDNDHIAHYGIVLDVEPQGNGIKINYYRLSPVPQQRLNEIVVKLGIQYASSFNEFDRTHWTIKEVDLIDELRLAGVSVLAPT